MPKSEITKSDEVKINPKLIWTFQVFRFSGFSREARGGFTLIELIVVIALLSTLFGTGALILGNFTKTQSLRVGGERLVQSLREAHTNSVAQKRDSAWGVKFDTTTDPDRYIVFKGNSYSGRDASFDQVNQFQKNVVVHTLNLSGGGSEVVFGKRSGLTNDSGFVRLAVDETYYDIAINGIGAVDFTY